jgi:hypothetical protein
MVFAFWGGTHVGRKRKKRTAATTRLSLFEKHVEGIGLVTRRGGDFGGAAPVFDRAFARMELRSFKLAYDQISGADIIVRESALAIYANNAEYICYLSPDECVDCQERIFSAINLTGE